MSSVVLQGASGPVKDTFGQGKALRRLAAQGSIHPKILSKRYMPQSSRASSPNPLSSRLGRYGNGTSVRPKHFQAQAKRMRQ